MRTLRVVEETWPVRGVFRISRGSRTEISVLTVRLEEAGVVGWAECAPLARYGESAATTLAAVESIRQALAAGMTRQDLQRALPAGAARNAVDCALWDLEAKLAGRPVWQLAGFDTAPSPVGTAVTISVDTPQLMAEAARQLTRCPLLKIKLGGAGDLERMEAVRAAVPTARLIVDANEAWTVDQCREFIPALAWMGVELIEQPLPAAEDEALRGMERGVPLCADESCHTRCDLDRLVGLYDHVNIKLDKAGGLTEALLLRRAAREAGFGLMIGGMVGTSLAMAPAILLTPGADFVDLDGPLLLRADREPPLIYGEGNTVGLASLQLWG